MTPMAARVALRFYNRHDSEKRIFMAEIESDVFTIGRSTDCQVCLDDEDVSRHHARIERSGNRWTITDLGSTNGIVIEGQRIRRAALAHGDSFRLGDTVLELQERTAP